jgi:hypothetical protein
MTQRWMAYRFGNHASIVVLAVLGVGMGAAMLLGGPDRFSADGFRTARMVPGGVYTWGGLLLAAGLVNLLGVLGPWSWRTVIVGLTLQGLWFAFFAVSLFMASVGQPRVAVTGPFAYGGLAALCAIKVDTARWVHAAARTGPGS